MDCLFFGLINAAGILLKGGQAVNVDLAATNVTVQKLVTASGGLFLGVSRYRDCPYLLDPEA